MSQNDPNARNGGDVPDSADDVILSEETAAPGARKPPPPTTLTPHDLATPYVLDALEVDEREAFERHLSHCATCQVRVADLEEAALLLPDALVAPPADLPDAFPFLLRDVAHETLPFPTESADEEAELGDSESAEDPAVISGDDEEVQFTPVADTSADDSESATSTELETPVEETEPQSDDVDEPLPAPARQTGGKRNKSKKRDVQSTPEPVGVTTEEPPAPQVPSRPPGRIRPGVRPQAGAQTGSATRGPARSAGLTPAVVAALALGVVALGLFLWALLLLGRVGDLEDEVSQQNEEIVTLRQQANATSYTLTPTTSGPQGASGTFFFSLPDQQGALVARGLAQAPDGWAYQIWFINDDESTPIAGPTFSVDANGEAVVPLTAEVSTFDAVAVSVEPVGGSPAPTSQVILQGRLGGAAG